MGRGDRPMDVYKPATRQWTRGATPPLQIHHAQAVEVDGKLYVVNALIGGFPEEKPLQNVLIYDPSVDQWQTGALIPESRRRGASGVVTHDGLVYVVGGNTRGHNSGYVPWLDEFNPKSGRWTPLDDAPHARDHFQAALINGRIYAAGGRRSSYDTGNPLSLTVAEVDVYDIEKRTWSTLDLPIPTQRAGTSSVGTAGKLVIVGGESDRQVSAHSEVEALDLKTGRWEILPALPVARHGTQAILNGSALHIVAGSGNRGGGPELDEHLILEGL